MRQAGGSRGGVGGRWCSEGSESEAQSGIWGERVSEKGAKREGGRMFWCFWNSQTSVRCRCLRGKHAAVFSYDRGRSRKGAGAYKPEQCTESAKHCILKIMWKQCTAPLHLCIVVSVVSSDSWNVRVYTVEISQRFNLNPVKLYICSSVSAKEEVISYFVE